MHNTKLSDYAKSRERDKKGRFVDTDNPKVKKFDRDQLHQAFIAGAKSSYSTVSRSPSEQFRIWCKQMGLTK